MSFGSEVMKLFDSYVFREKLHKNRTNSYLKLTVTLLNIVTIKIVDMETLDYTIATLLI